MMISVGPIFLFLVSPLPHNSVPFCMCGKREEREPLRERRKNPTYIMKVKPFRR